jgi:hypothetical protein
VLEIRVALTIQEAPTLIDQRRDPLVVVLMEAERELDEPL